MLLLLQVIWLEVLTEETADRASCWISDKHHLDMNGRKLSRHVTMQSSFGTIEFTIAVYKLFSRLISEPL